MEFLFSSSFEIIGWYFTVIQLPSIKSEPFAPKTIFAKLEFAVSVALSNTRLEISVASRRP